MTGGSQQHLLAERRPEEIEMDRLDTMSQQNLDEELDDQPLKPDSESQSRLELETSFPKFLPFIYLVPPTVAVIALLASRGHKYTADLLVDISTTNGRATAQVLVQVTSHTLGMLQVMVLGSMLSFALRLMLASGRPATLQTLSFWTSLSPARFNYTLPPFYMFAALSILFASLIPGALWAGALSPIVTTASNSSESLLVPIFTNDSAGTWNSQFQWHRYPDGHQTIYNVQDRCVRNDDTRGFVPSCPVPDLQSLLLFSGSSATPPDGSRRDHSKLDNPEWEYLNRSFGVGSSIGLVDNSFSSMQVEAYTYTESGYAVGVQCVKNSTSRFAIRHTGSAAGGLNIYHAQGWLPNMFDNEDFGVELNDSYGYNESYPTFSWYDDYRDMAAWTAHTSDSSSMIGIATGKKGRYTELNNTQCEVQFVPAVFKVTANRTEHSIEVNQENRTPQDFDPTGRLQWVVVNSINLLARMSPSLYVSVLGDTLERNFHNMKARHPGSDQEEAVTSGIAEAFAAMIDDVLVAYSASQLVHTNDSTPVNTTTYYPAVQIGKSTAYLYLVTIVHTIVVFVWFFEAVRTRLWRQLPGFNYLDIKSVIVASSAGSNELSRKVEQHKSSNGSKVGGLEVVLQPSNAERFAHEDRDTHYGYNASDRITVVQRGS